MGALSEAARIKAKLNKSWHPVTLLFFLEKMHAELNKKKLFCIWENSIFEWLTNQDAKISIIDLPDQNSMTYYHYVEEKNRVNWRYQKNLVLNIFLQIELKNN